MTSSPVPLSLARSLVLDELLDLTLYRRLVPAASPPLRDVLERLIPVETRHLEFWRQAFDAPPPALDAGRRLKLAVLVLACRLGGDNVIRLVLEGIEVHGIRKYLSVWEMAKGTSLEGSVRAILEDELSHEDAIVLSGAASRFGPEKVRSLFLGFNDGCVEILGAVSGFMAAFQSTAHVLAASLSVAVAGALSMAAGSYVALGSEREVSSLERAKARFRGGPVAPDQADGGVAGSAVVVGVSYLAGAVVPVLPLLLGARGLAPTVLAGAAAVSFVSLVVAFLTGMRARRRMLQNLLIVAAAVAVTSFIGAAARALWGIDL